jgi:hypothetical protein
MYTVLSYCWGSIPKLNPLRTLKSNINSFMESIAVSSLPKTIRDAIDVTRELGIRYLWVDSICIIQDDELDWKMESQNMGQIFENAICTIAATGAKHCEQGLFLNSASPDSVCVANQYNSVRLPCVLSETAVENIWIGKLAEEENGFDTDMSLSAWYWRAWVVQERILSRRIMHFAKGQLYWECQEAIYRQSYSEPLPLQYRLLTKPAVFQRLVSEATSFSRWSRSSHNLQTAKNMLVAFKDKTRYLAGMASDLEDPQPVLNRFWARVIQNYNHCKLTVDTDKLIAIEGLARAISRLTGETYFRGIWLEDVSRGLYWTAGTSPSAFFSDELRKLAKGEKDRDICHFTF